VIDWFRTVDSIGCLQHLKHGTKIQETELEWGYSKRSCWHFLRTRWNVKGLSGEGGSLHFWIQMRTALWRLGPHRQAKNCRPARPHTAALFKRSHRPLNPLQMLKKRDVLVWLVSLLSKLVQETFYVFMCLTHEIHFLYSWFTLQRRLHGVPKPEKRLETLTSRLHPSSKVVHIFVFHQLRPSRICFERLLSFIIGLTTIMFILL
jgi:hypothetical protein